MEDEEGDLSSGRITGIRKSKDGMLWVQKSQENFILFNPETESVEPFSGLMPTGLEYLELLYPKGQGQLFYFKDENGKIYHLDSNQNISPFGKMQILPDEYARPTPWGTVIIFKPTPSIFEEWNAQGENVRSNEMLSQDYDLFIEEENHVQFSYDIEPVFEYLHELLFSIESDGTLTPIVLKKNGIPPQVSELTQSKTTICSIDQGQPRKYLY